MNEITFEGFPKIPRLNRNVIITEKLDGTNAQVIITEDGQVGAASRNRLITEEDDNYGFARWVNANRGELLKLGPGRHFGEWWGQGIQRGYGLAEKRFSLFNTSRWVDNPSRPSCCHVVPVLYQGLLEDVEGVLESLRMMGSVAAPFFANPEGIIVYHTAARQMFKVLLDHDDIPKGLVNGIRN